MLFLWLCKMGTLSTQGWNEMIPEFSDGKGKISIGTNDGKKISGNGLKTSVQLSLHSGTEGNKNRKKKHI